MGAISRTATRCRKCPDRDICQNKRMELCQYFDELANLDTGLAFNVQTATNSVVLIVSTPTATTPHESLMQTLVREYEKKRRRGDFCRW